MKIWSISHHTYISTGFSPLQFQPEQASSAMDKGERERSQIIED